MTKEQRERAIKAAKATLANKSASAKEIKAALERVKSLEVTTARAMPATKALVDALAAKAAAARPPAAPPATPQARPLGPLEQPSLIAGPALPTRPPAPSAAPVASVAAKPVAPPASEVPQFTFDARRGLTPVATTKPDLTRELTINGVPQGVTVADALNPPAAVPAPALTPNERIAQTTPGMGPPADVKITPGLPGSLAALAASYGQPPNLMAQPVQSRPQIASAAAPPAVKQALSVLGVPQATQSPVMAGAPAVAPITGGLQPQTTHGVARGAVANSDIPPAVQHALSVLGVPQANQPTAIAGAPKVINEQLAATKLAAKQAFDLLTNPPTPATVTTPQSLAPAVVAGNNAPNVTAKTGVPAVTPNIGATALRPATPVTSLPGQIASAGRPPTLPGLPKARPPGPLEQPSLIAGPAPLGAKMGLEQFGPPNLGRQLSIAGVPLGVTVADVMNRPAPTAVATRPATPAPVPVSPVVAAVNPTQQPSYNPLSSMSPPAPMMGPINNPPAGFNDLPNATAQQLAAARQRVASLNAMPALPPTAPPAQMAAPRLPVARPQPLAPAPVAVSQPPPAMPQTAAMPGLMKAAPKPVAPAPRPADLRPIAPPPLPKTPVEQAIEQAKMNGFGGVPGYSPQQMNGFGGVPGMPGAGIMDGPYKGLGAPYSLADKLKIGAATIGFGIPGAAAAFAPRAINSIRNAMAPNNRALTSAQQAMIQAAQIQAQQQAMAAQQQSILQRQAAEVAANGGVSPNYRGGVNDGGGWVDSRGTRAGYDPRTGVTTGVFDRAGNLHTGGREVTVGRGGLF